MGQLCQQWLRSISQTQSNLCHPIHKLVKGKPVIKVPGCPPIGEVMAGVIVHYLTFGTIPELDRLGRPKAFYSKRVHDTCYRRPFYDAGFVCRNI